MIETNDDCVTNLFYLHLTVDKWNYHKHDEYVFNSPVHFGNPEKKLSE